MDDRAKDEVERGEGEEGRAPAEAFDEEVRERNEGRAGEAADEGHDGDAAAGERTEVALQHGKSRLVQDRAHGGAKEDPKRDERFVALDDRPEDEECRREKRSARHDGAPVAPVDEAPDRHRAEGRGRKAEREGGGGRGVDQPRSPNIGWMNSAKP